MKGLKKFIRNCLIILLVLTPLFFTSKCQGNILKRNGVEGIGKITDIRETRQGKTTRKIRVFIEYFLNGKQFHANRTKREDVKIGECFQIFYVPENPTNMIIDLNEKVACSKKKDE